MKSIFIYMLLIASVSAKAGSYDSKIKQIQAEGLNDPYNTIHLKLDVTDSPCSSTNQNDRFAISDEVQQSVALAAIMADKKIILMSSGSCNSAQIETVNYIMIRADQ